MKKANWKIIVATLVVLVTLSLVAIPSVMAQSGEQSKQTEEYCMILATSNLLGTKVTITVDHGQEVKLFKNTGAVRDDEGKMKKFNSVVDALNYMNEDGWVFVDAYTVTIGQQNVYHYMMKRVVTPK